MNKKYQFGDVEVEVPEFDFRKVLPVFLIAVIFLLAYLSVYSVKADEQGVLLRFGKFSSIAPPGLHFKIPTLTVQERVQHNDPSCTLIQIVQ